MTSFLLAGVATLVGLFILTPICSAMARLFGLYTIVEERQCKVVTSAIKQDGANQVSIITSTAERQAAIEFAKAAAMRPQIVGAALQKISQDQQIVRAMFDVLEMEKIVQGEAEITLIPARNEMIGQFMAAVERNPRPPVTAPPLKSPR